MADGIKTCSKCRESKPHADFYRDRTTRDGWGAKCKACAKAYVAGRKDELAEYQREWYERNRASVLRRTAEYQRSNPERSREYSRRYNEANREQRQQYSAAYRAADPERHSRQAAAFRDRHPEKYRRDAHRRRAALAEVEHDPRVTVESLRERDGDGCCYCPQLLDFEADQYAPSRATLEHITPVSKGGSHTFDNTALACRACNVSKRNSTFLWKWVGRLPK